MILQMVKFDILRTDSLLQKIFNFDLERQPSLNSRFEKAKYESSNFVLNMGSMFFIQIVYLVGAGLVPLLRWLCHRQSFFIERRLQRIKLFNNFSRFYLESMLEVSICVLMTLKLMKFDFWKTSQLVYSNLWAFGNLCILAIMPVILCYVAMQYHKKYNTDWDYREQYDDIFSELKGRSKLSMLYFTFFTLRRYAFAICLIAMPNRYLFQTYTQIIASTFFFLYIIEAKPQKDQKQGKMELFNELTISISLYFLFIFTDFCPDSTTRYKAGWAKVSLILTNLLINVSVMMVQSFFEYKIRIKNWWARRKLRIMQRARLKSIIADLDNQINQPSAVNIIQQLDEPLQIRQLQIQEPTVQEMLDYDIKHHLHAVQGRAPQEQAPVEQRIIDNFYSQFEEYKAPELQIQKRKQNDPSVQSMLDYQLEQLYEARLRPPQKQTQVNQRLIDNFYSQFEEYNAPRLQRPKTPTPQEPKTEKEESVQGTQALKHYIQAKPRHRPPQKQVYDHQRLLDNLSSQLENQNTNKNTQTNSPRKEEAKAEHKEESVQDVLDYCIKNYIQAKPKHGPPQKQAPVDQRLIDNFYSQFENQNATRRFDQQSKKQQENTKRSTTPTKTKKTDDAREDSSGCQFVLNGSTQQPSSRSQTPADVIEEYNHKQESEKQLFGNILKRRRF